MCKWTQESDGQPSEIIAIWNLENRIFMLLYRKAINSESIEVVSGDGDKTTRKSKWNSTKRAPRETWPEKERVILLATLASIVHKRNEHNRRCPSICETKCQKGCHKPGKENTQNTHQNMLSRPTKLVIKFGHFGSKEHPQKGRQ